VQLIAVLWFDTDELWAIICCVLLAVVRQTCDRICERVVVTARAWIAHRILRCQSARARQHKAYGTHPIATRPDSILLTLSFFLSRKFDIMSAAACTSSALCARKAPCPVPPPCCPLCFQVHVSRSNVVALLLSGQTVSSRLGRPFPRSLLQGRMAYHASPVPTSLLLRCTSCALPFVVG
jgi:hypothetical protein